MDGGEEEIGRILPRLRAPRQGEDFLIRRDLERQLPVKGRLPAGEHCLGELKEASLQAGEAAVFTNVDQLESPTRVLKRDRDKSTLERSSARLEWTVDRPAEAGIQRAPASRRRLGCGLNASQRQ